MQWFRLHASTVNNPKAQKLSGDMFKIWINILCIACENEGALPPVDDLAFLLRVTSQEMSHALHTLVTSSLISVTKNQHGEVYAPKDWNEWQYKSDTSAERTRRYRERKKTSHQNVTVTPPDTDSDTDTEADKKEEAKASSKENPRATGTAPRQQLLSEADLECDMAFEQFWGAFPPQRRGNKTKGRLAWLRAINEKRATAEEIKNGLSAYRVSDEVNRGFAKGAAAWLNDDRWKTDYTTAPRQGGQRDQPQASYLDKIQAAGNKALESLNRRMEADRDAPWNQGDPVRPASCQKALPHGNHKPLAGSFSDHIDENDH